MECSQEKLEFFEFMDHKSYLRKNHYVWCKRCKCSINSHVAIYPCKGSKDRPREQGIFEKKLIAPLKMEYSYKGKKFVLDICPDEMR
jgi:hypothetical protein